MSDTVKTSNSLQLVAEFIDGDTRTITLDNPRENLTATDIDNLNPVMIAGLVGDKAGSQFYRWKTAAKVGKVTTELDIGN